MTAVLLDTHAWAWILTLNRRLSAGAVDAVTRAEMVFVSPITFFEITQKVRLGKWPEMAPHAGRLSAILAEKGGRQAPLDTEICARAGALDWPHRDPFDRILAATAEQQDMPLISIDPVFDTLASVRRIW